PSSHQRTGQEDGDSAGRSVTSLADRADNTVLKFARARRVGKGAGNANPRHATYRAPCPPAEPVQVAQSMVGTAHDRHAFVFNAMPAPLPTLRSYAATLIAP